MSEFKDREICKYTGNLQKRWSEREEPWSGQQDFQPQRCFAPNLLWGLHVLLWGHWLSKSSCGPPPNPPHDSTALLSPGGTLDRSEELIKKKKNTCIPQAHPRDPDSMLYFFIFLIIIFIYLFMRDTERERQGHREREAETQAKGEAGSLQGARCGIPSWVSRIMPWTEGRC